jgi:hypothetical protein
LCTFFPMFPFFLMHTSCMKCSKIFVVFFLFHCSYIIFSARQLVGFFLILLPLFLRCISSMHYFSFCFIFWQLHYFIFVSCAFFPLALFLNLLCFLQSIFFLMWLHF